MKATRSTTWGIPKISLIIVAVLLLVVPAMAYEITIDAPTSIPKGQPLVVNGTTTLPPGVSVDIVLYRSEYTSEEISRQTVTIQADKVFTVIFDTENLEGGQYKVEVPVATGTGISYLGNSVTMRVVQITDRTSEIQIKSPMDQENTGTLSVRGVITGLGNSGVQISVIGPDDQTVFGPQYIKTNDDGSFSQNVPITKEGTYTVSFTDAKGYIGLATFTVYERTVVTTTPTPTPTATVPALTASTTASFDDPAYFLVTTGTGPVKITTSSGVDWVIEYPDPAGVVQKVNLMGQLEGETVTLQGIGDTVPIKVYPYRMSDQGIVTLSAEGATAVVVATGVPSTFEPTASPTTKSPLPLPLILAALGGCALFVAYRMKTR
jgi:5-hydroxyisourate hydrolase-like protein (transthyretin family)